MFHTWRYSTSTSRAPFTGIRRTRKRIPSPFSHPRYFDGHCIHTGIRFLLPSFHHYSVSSIIIHTSQMHTSQTSSLLNGRKGPCIPRLLQLFASPSLCSSSPVSEYSLHFFSLWFSCLLQPLHGDDRDASATRTAQKTGANPRQMFLYAASTYFPAPLNSREVIFVKVPELTLQLVGRGDLVRSAGQQICMWL